MLADNLPAGGFADPQRIEVGATADCTLEVTAAYVDAFAVWSADDNPLHLDEAVGRQQGFPGRVAHGMVALGMLSRLIGTRLPGPGALWIGQETQFVAPIIVGDRLQARVTVLSVSRAARVVELSTEVVKSDSGTTVLRGKARVRIPQRPVLAAPNGTAAQ